MSDKDWQTARKVEQLKGDEGRRRLAETKPKALRKDIQPRTKNNGAGNWRN